MKKRHIIFVLGLQRDKIYKFLYEESNDLIFNPFRVLSFEAIHS